MCYTSWIRSYWCSYQTGTDLKKKEDPRRLLRVIKYRKNRTRYKVTVYCKGLWNKRHRKLTNLKWNLWSSKISPKKKSNPDVLRTIVFFPTSVRQLYRDLDTFKEKQLVRRKSPRVRTGKTLLYDKIGEPLFWLHVLHSGRPL